MIQSQSDKQIQLLLKISRAYYIDEQSQAQIGNNLGLSRPTVSRYLKLAKDNGIVEIKIHDPLSDVESLETQLKKKFNLKNVLISLDANTDEQKIINSLGILAANYLNKIVSNDDTIGISWGKTIEAVSKNLIESQKQNINVVHLKGSVSNSHLNNFSAEITNRFNDAFHTQSRILPLPVIFDLASTKKIVEQDRFISEVIAEGKSANIALFTVGTVRPTALLFSLGYLDNDEIQNLESKAVGDIMSHFIDSKCNIVNNSLDARTVAIDLDQLKKKKYSILVAGGEAKVKPIYSALIGKCANVLITDLQVAKKLLTME